MIEKVTPGEYNVDLGGTDPEWPEFTMAMGGIHLWAERVVQAFQENELRGVAFYPQRLRKIEGRRLKRESYPDYYWAHALSGVPAIPYLPTDRATPCPVNPKTGLYETAAYFGREMLWRFDFSEWDGADFFYISTVDIGLRFCTERFKDLVEARGFTNFRFLGAVNEGGNEFVFF